MKRSRREIITEILEICRDGANKTRIVYGANLNFRTATQYLQGLIDNHLIDVDLGKYQTTKKGISLLERVNQVNKQLYRHEKTEPRAVEESFRIGLT